MEINLEKIDQLLKFEKEIAGSADSSEPYLKEMFNETDGHETTISMTTTTFS